MTRLSKCLIAALTFVSVFSLSSCQKGPEIHSGTALGARVKSFEIPVEGALQEVEVLSNGDYAISALERNVEWLEFPSSVPAGQNFSFTCSPNENVPRSARLVLSIANHRDTVTVKQHGLNAPKLDLKDKGFIVKSQAGSFSQKIDTNIPSSDISVVQLGYDNWVSNLKVTGETDNVSLTFDYSENTSDSAIRQTIIVLSFTDGWGETTSTQCTITQETSAGTLGKESSFPDVYKLATTAGSAIGEDILIDAYVVSDKDSGNAGENPQSSTSTVDYSMCRKTLYLESVDGNYGLMFELKEEGDNIFKIGDRIKINLRGVRLYESARYIDTDPTFVYGTGLSSARVVSLVNGTRENLPVKQKAMSELTDNDIFTYVTLQNCEFPVRKGNLTPVNEGYANATGAHRLSKFPVAIMDKSGSTMYVLTNTTCMYRRDGSRLPYGSGSISGVIVHEHFTRYNYMDNNTGDEETYGDIGKYQIRHTCREDIWNSMSAEEGRSNILAEWRYVNATYKAKYACTDGEQKSAYFMHTFRYPTTKEGEDPERTCLNFDVDYCYLGPCGDADTKPFGRHIGNENGLGVILEDGTDWMGPTDTKSLNRDNAQYINKSWTGETTADGKGKVPNTCGSAWKVWYNRDTTGVHELGPEAAKMRGFVVAFSTKGISANHIMFTYCMLNPYYALDGSYYFGPRWWTLEYSLTDVTGRDDSPGVWNTIVDKFMVPDTVNWSPFTAMWQCAGFKQMCVELPAAVHNQQNVYIRIVPLNDLHGTGISFAEPVDSKNSRTSIVPWSAMNYIGIRYN